MRYLIQMFSGNGSADREEKFAPVETYNLAVEVDANSKKYGVGDYKMYSLLYSSDYKLYIGKRYTEGHTDNTKAPESLVITSIKWDRVKEMSMTDGEMSDGFPAIFYKVTVNYTDDPETAKITAGELDYGGEETNDNRLLSFSTSTELLERRDAKCYGLAYTYNGSSYTPNKEATTEITPTVMMRTTSGTPLVDVPHNVSVLVYNFTVKYDTGWDSKNTLKFHNSINITPITIAGLLISERHAWIKSISEERVLQSSGIGEYSKISYSIAIQAEHEWIFENQNMDTWALFLTDSDGNLIEGGVTSDNRRKIRNGDVVASTEENKDILKDTVSERQALAWDGRVAPVDPDIDIDFRKPHSTYWLDKKQLDWSPLGLPKNNRLESEIELENNALGD